MAPTKSKNKFCFTKILLVSYIVLSLLFIAISVFNSTKQFVYNVGVQNGQAMTINSVIEQGTKNCKGFTLFSGNAKLSLVDIACLEQPEETNVN